VTETLDIPFEPSRTEKQATEQDMLRRLQVKHTQDSGNGPAWAFVPHVRNKAGFDATRTADAIAMHLWPSRGLALHGFEVKVSRGDWLRELKKPEKADVFCAIVDFWWLVVSDKTIVRPGELPDNWGLMVAHGNGLRTVTAAKALRVERDPVGRSFLAALLRSATRVQSAGPVEIQEAVEAERERLSKMHNATYEGMERRYQELEQKVRAFETTAGIQIGSRWAHATPPEEVGRAVRMVLNGEQDVERTENRLRALARQARDLADELDAAVPPKEASEIRPPLVRSARR
jgi:hypothetical protein